MGRRIIGILVGAVLLVVVTFVIDGAATGLLHIEGLDHADGDHPHAALALSGVAFFALGALAGGAAGAFAAAKIAQWRTAAWVVGVVGALEALVTAQLFANVGTFFIATTLAMALGCWLGARLAGRG